MDAAGIAAPLLCPLCSGTLRAWASGLGRKKVQLELKVGLKGTELKGTVPDQVLLVTHV